MSKLLESARGLTMLAYYFAGSSFVGLGLLLGGVRGPRARAAIIAHSDRARRLGRVTIELRGEEHLPRDRPFVLVYNETSMVDAMLIPCVMWPFTDLGVGAAEFGRVPLMTTIARRTGLHLIRRGDRAAADRMLDELSAKVAAGGRLAMGGEGRLSPDGEVGHFKRGPFLIAIRAGAPVVPLCAQGGRELMRPGSLRLRPGLLRYRIGPPIETTGLTVENAPELAERVRERVAGMYAECRR